MIQSNLAIRNFSVTLKLFLNAKCSLSLWSKLAFGRGKWFLNTNLFLIKTFLIAKLDCTIISDLHTFFQIPNACSGYNPKGSLRYRWQSIKYSFIWYFFASNAHCMKKKSMRLKLIKKNQSTYIGTCNISNFIFLSNRSLIEVKYVEQIFQNIGKS